MNKTSTAVTLADLADSRIEACLDACEDIDTETLQRLGAGSFALLSERLTRYQEFAHRLHGVLSGMHERGGQPTRLDSTLLASFRAEAAFLLHQETQPEQRHANH